MPSRWASKPMLRAILYTIILTVMSQIVAQYLFVNITDVFAANFSMEAFKNPERNQEEKGAIVKSWYSFLLKELPRRTAVATVVAALRYRWQCFLEWILPGRPRPAAIIEEPHEKVAENDDLEEEMMRKLIAKGRVRRASINWCNVQLKWMIDVTIGLFLFTTIEHYLEILARLHTSEGFVGDMGTIGLAVVASYIFEQSAIISLINFIIIPVQHRVPFEAAWGLVRNVFVGSFLSVFLPWLSSKEVVQQIWRNASLAAAAQNNATNTTTGQLRLGHPGVAEL